MARNASDIPGGDHGRTDLHAVPPKSCYRSDSEPQDLTIASRSRRSRVHTGQVAAISRLSWLRSCPKFEYGKHNTTRFSLGVSAVQAHEEQAGFDGKRTPLGRAARRSLTVTPLHSIFAMGWVRSSWKRITYYVATGRRIVLVTVFTKTRKRERLENRSGLERYAALHF
jgi:hypothetical protein